MSRKHITVLSDQISHFRDFGNALTLYVDDIQTERMKRFAPLGNGLFMRLITHFLNFFTKQGRLENRFLRHIQQVRGALNAFGINRTEFDLLNTGRRMIALAKVGNHWNPTFGDAFVEWMSDHDASIFSYDHLRQLPWASLGHDSNELATILVARGYPKPFNWQKGKKIIRNATFTTPMIDLLLETDPKTNNAHINQKKLAALMTTVEGVRALLPVLNDYIDAQRSGLLRFFAPWLDSFNKNIRQAKRIQRQAETVLQILTEDKKAHTPLAFAKAGLILTLELAPFFDQKPDADPDMVENLFSGFESWLFENELYKDGDFWEFVKKYPMDVKIRQKLRDSNLDEGSTTHCLTQLNAIESRTVLTTSPSLTSRNPAKERLSAPCQRISFLGHAYADTQTATKTAQDRPSHTAGYGGGARPNQRPS